MPNPSPGVAADRSVGVMATVPDPIPHTLDGRQDCFGCHATGAVDAPAVPAGHAQDVTLCTTCHAVWLAPAIAAAAAPAIPHDLTGRDDCLVCHKTGAANAPRVPDNHTGLPSSLCRTCHIPQGEVAGAGTGTGTPVAQAPAIPHGLEGFQACTSCHEKGGPGIPQFPANHQGRTDDIVQRATARQVVLQKLRPPPSQLLSLLGGHPPLLATQPRGRFCSPRTAPSVMVRTVRVRASHPRPSIVQLF